MNKLNSVSTPGVQLCAVMLAFAFLPWAPQKQILGVSLRPAAEILLNKIEHEFGAPLDIQRRSSMIGEIWRGYVSDTGVPTLEIPPEARITEAQIVHELLHLDQRLRGFPNGVTFLSDKESPVIPVFGPVNERLAPILGFFLYDTIEHVIFAHRLAEMGIDPHLISRAAIQRVVSARGLPSGVAIAAQAGSPTESLALWHFKVAIEAGDPKLVADSDKANTISPSGLRKGKALARIVASDHPETPQDAADTVVDSLNCLFDDVASFSFSGWQDIQKGKFVERKVIVRVEPPVPASDACDDEEER